MSLQRSFFKSLTISHTKNKVIHRFPYSKYETLQDSIIVPTTKPKSVEPITDSESEEIENDEMEAKSESIINDNNKKKKNNNKENSNNKKNKKKQKKKDIKSMTYDISIPENLTALKKNYKLIHGKEINIQISIDNIDSIITAI